MKETDPLRQLLELEPLESEPVDFLTFLRELKDHPERADTAAALFVRAVKDKGEVNLEELAKSSPERFPYHQMLAELKIPSYRAFERVRGSQRLVYKLMKHYEAGAENGYQLRQMLALCGGPGSGKSFLVDFMLAVLEGKEVWAVKDCPVHENPLNLLNLLEPEVRERLAEELGMGEVLKDLMAVSLQPCADCFQRVMGVSRDEAEAVDAAFAEGAAESGEKPKPNLGDLQVVALRLSSRHAGISVWSPSAPGQGCSLKKAIIQGSRGMVRMSEAFAADGAVEGSVNELQVLLEATEGRRIPGEGCEEITGFVPSDTLIVAETNEGAFNRFVKNQPDPDAFTRRSKILTVPYNTILSEEVQAYRDFIDTLKSVPDIDPIALRMAAIVAVASRMPDKIDGEEVYPDLITRMRMYDGEQLVVEKKQSDLRSSASARTWGSDMFDSAGRGRTQQSESGDGKNLTVDDLWLKAAEKEGLYGLNMGFMLAAVSEMCERAMETKKQCLTSLAVIKFMQARIKRWLTTPGLQEHEKSFAERALAYLETAKFAGDRTGIVEQEYRRLLRNQLLEVFAPDFEERAAEDYEKYRQHASASARGDKEFMYEDPTKGGKKRKVRVDEEFLESLEQWLRGEGTEDKQRFRGSIDAQITHYVRLAAEHAELEDGEVPAVEITWETIPELADAIRKRLNTEIAERIGKIVTSNKADLDADDAKLREDAFERFKQLGYSELCAKLALQYAKDHKLWESQG